MIIEVGDNEGFVQIFIAMFLEVKFIKRSTSSSHFSTTNEKSSVKMLGVKMLLMVKRLLLLLE